MDLHRRGKKCVITINAADVAKLDLGLIPTHAPTVHEELFPKKYTGG